jgi:hypothetical protein
LIIGENGCANEITLAIEIGLLDVLQGSLGLVGIP